MIAEDFNIKRSNLSTLSNRNENGSKNFPWEMLPIDKTFRNFSQKVPDIRLTNFGLIDTSKYAITTSLPHRI